VSGSVPFFIKIQSSLGAQSRHAQHCVSCQKIMARTTKVCRTLILGHTLQHSFNIHGMLCNSDLEYLLKTCRAGTPTLVKDGETGAFCGGGPVHQPRKEEKRKTT